MEAVRGMDGYFLELPITPLIMGIMTYCKDV